MRLRDRLFDLGHNVVASLQRVYRLVHFFLGFQRELFLVQRGKRQLYVHAAVGLDYRPERPIFLGLERAYFAFSLDDEPQRNRLHSACRQIALDFFAKHGRNLVAHKPVEYSSRLLRVDKIQIDFSGVAQSFLHGLLRNLVKLDSDRGFFVQPKHVCDMPRNGFALAVRVSREIYFVRLGRELFKLLYGFLFIGQDFVARLEILFNVNRQRANGQVAYMSLCGKYLISLAEILFNGFYLSCTFDNNKFH